ncbi:MAG TPA: hypothetical protein VHC94_05535 [Nitrobacter sp.]|nr:hypothetical protein [Nitrobacter sp.]
MLTEYLAADHEDADLLTPAQVKQFIDTMLANFRFNDEYTAVVYDSEEIRRLNPVDRQIAGLIYGAKRFRAKIVENDISDVADEIQELSTEVKIPIRRGSINEKIVGRELLRASADYYDECAHRECKERDLPPPTDLQALSAEALRAKLSELLQSAHQPVDHKVESGKTASQVWPKFLEDRDLANMKERPEKLTASLNLWTSYHGDIPVAAWTGEMAHDLRRFYFTLPSKYAQEKKWKTHGSLKDIAAAFQQEIENAPDDAAKQRLKAAGTKHSTWNRHNAALTAFWDWAKKNDLTTRDANPFTGLFLKSSSRRKPWNGGSEKRIHWSEKAMEKLFASPLFTGCKSLHRRHVPGSVVVRDALYWVVLIIAYTGMRREEVCQLRVEHLCRDEDTGIWFFNLKAEGLDLKDTSNEEDEDAIAAKRWVPVPNALIELGIIECLHSGRAAGQQLFRELRPYGTDKKFGTKVGKDFARYRKNYDQARHAKGNDSSTLLYVRLMDLHSFRHNICSSLIDVGVPQAHAEEVSGHKSESRKTAFANYDRGRTLEVLKGAIERLKRPIDLPRLVQAIHNSSNPEK